MTLLADDVFEETDFDEGVAFLVDEEGVAFLVDDEGVAFLVDEEGVAFLVDEDGAAFLVDAVFLLALELVTRNRTTFNP